MINKIPVIHRTNEKTNLAIKQLMQTGLFANENQSFVVLRAAMKALRDRLTPDEALHLAAQLPALLRGFYFEGWTLRSYTKIRSKEGFLEKVKFHMHGHDEINVEETAPAALKVILDMIDQGEAIDIIHQLPKDIQELCPE